MVRPFAARFVTTFGLHHRCRRMPMNRLRNRGMWRTHAADLQVTVRGADGTIMQETVIRPDHDMIDAQAESGFFVQLAVEAGREAHVTVTPLANRIAR